MDYFDEPVAASYETRWPELFGPDAIDAVVNFLADLAGLGPALELGIGTGRIALPLSQRGIRVHGIDLSSAMVARLPTKPGPTWSTSSSATSRRPELTDRSGSPTCCATRS